MSTEPYCPDALETPAYVYDLGEVRRSYAILREALPQPSDLYYSLKANPHPVVLQQLRAVGCRAEVCSPGELDAARAAGFDPEHIIYTGPGKRDRDLIDALKAGVGVYSVDSAVALDQLDALAGANGVRVRALLRINDDQPAPGQSLSMTGVASQFGVDASIVLSRPELFGPRPAVTLAGFHLYTGTNVHEEDALVAQFDQVAATARRLADVTGLAVEILDLGGGFGAPFARNGELPVFGGLSDRVAGLLDGCFPGWRKRRPAVAFESGRYLTATCGTLLTRVLDSKVSHDSPVVVLDAGINQLGGMAGLRRLLPVVPDVLTVAPSDPTAGDRPAGERRDTMVSGPLCTPTDLWSRSVPLEDLAPGQLLAVPNVGAYGLTASLVAFLGHPPAIEVTVDRGHVLDVSRLDLRRQTVLDQKRG